MFLPFSSAPLGTVNIDHKNTVFNCPKGEYISQISGNYDQKIRGLRVKCSGGSTSPTFGGASGTAYTDTSVDGYIGFGMARAKDSSFDSNFNSIPPEINAIQFKRANATLANTFGSAGGITRPEFKCPYGTLSGVSLGSNSTDISSLSLICDGPTSTVSNQNTVVGQLQVEYDIAKQQIYDQKLTIPPPLSQKALDIVAANTTTTRKPPAQQQQTTQQQPAEKPVSIWLWVGVGFLVLIFIILMIVIIVIATKPKPDTD